MKERWVASLKVYCITVLKHTYIAYTTHAAISFVNQCYTVSTPDASGTTKYYRSPYNQWWCLHWMLRSATNPRTKTAAAFCLWCADTNFKWFSTIVLSRPGRHQRCGASSVDTVLLTYREQTKQPRRPIADLPLLEFSPALESWSDIYMGPISCLIVPQMFSALDFIRHFYLSVTRLGCSLNALSSTSWALHADWLQVCFGTRPRLKKMTYPTFNCSMLRRGCVAVYAGSENSQIASKIS